MLLNLLRNLFSKRNILLVKSNRCYMLVMEQNTLYTIIVHLRYSTLFYNTAFFSLFCLDNSQNQYILYYDFIYKYNIQFRLLTLTTNHAISIQALYTTATWYERECSELLPINFIGSTDTRLLLLPYCSKGIYPLRRSVTFNSIKERPLINKNATTQY